MNTFFYGVLPYIALTIFVGGTIVRYTVFERGWTTKSSEFLAKKSLKWANPVFHLGLLMAFGGHFIGILVPKFVTEAAGTDEATYHMISLAGGIPAAVLFLGGFLWLMKRRFFEPHEGQHELDGQAALSRTAPDHPLGHRGHTLKHLGRL